MIDIPIQPVLVFILALIRVMIFFSMLPLFGDIYTPVRARVVLSVAVAAVLAPLLSASEIVFPQTLSQCVAMMIPEAMLGLAFGLVGRILFATAQIAGQVMGEQIGFGMAAIMDPAQGNQMPIVAEAIYILALLLFLTLDGHHLFLGALGSSFEQAPPGGLVFSRDMAAFFTQKTSDMFWIAVQMSMPVVAVIFATNMAMGMVAKAVPQLNVFLESFPIRIIVGLLLLSVTLGLVARMLVAMFGTMKGDLLRILSMITG